MNNNLEFENEDPEPYEDGPRSNYGAGWENNSKSELQKAYENLDFPPGCNIKTVLTGLAMRFSMTYDELIKNIEL